MEWSDEAVLLAIARHGEHHAIIDCLTATRGRWRGLVRGGKGRRMQGILQPGNEVAARWRARLDHQLGAVEVEPTVSRIADILGDADRLLALMAATGTVMATLPEREPHGAVYQALRAFLDLLADQEMAALDWGGALVRLELGLLTDLGYGLDLGSCAATGSLDELVHVSPKSGRAVSREAGRPWADRLLALPAFLLRPDARPEGRTALADGLRLTGHFLEALVAAQQARDLPRERGRLLDRLSSEGR